MKAALLIALSLVVGIGLGIAATRREFSAEQLPTEQYLRTTQASNNPKAAGAKPPAALRRCAQSSASPKS